MIVEDNNNTEISKLKLQDKLVLSPKPEKSAVICPHAFQWVGTEDGKPKGHLVPVAEGWKQVFPGWYMAKEAFHYLQFNSPQPPSTQHVIIGITLCS